MFIYIISKINRISLTQSTSAQNDACLATLCQEKMPNHQQQKRQKHKEPTKQIKHNGHTKQINEKKRN